MKFHRMMLGECTMANFENFIARLWKIFHVKLHDLAEAKAVQMNFHSVIVRGAA